MEYQASETIPAPIRRSYNLFFQLCLEKNAEIDKTDSSIHSFRFTPVSGDTIEASFKSLNRRETSLTLTVTNPSRPDFSSDALYSEWIEPFIDRVENPTSPTELEAIVWILLEIVLLVILEEIL